MSDISGVLIAAAIALAGVLVAGAIQLSAEAQCLAAGGEVVRTKEPADQCKPLALAVPSTPNEVVK